MKYPTNSSPWYRPERANEFLKTFSKLSFWGTVNQVSVRFPVLYPFIMMALLPGLAAVAPKLQRENTKYMRERIQNRHKLAHEDYMSALIRTDQDVPDLDFLVAQSMNLVIGNAEAVSNMFTSSIYLLLVHPEKLGKLQQEVRGRFASYEEIKYDSVQGLAWLNAVINEALRYATNGTSGLPRISPGAVVDGHYIPKGVRRAPLSHRSHPWIHRPINSLTYFFLVPCANELSGHFPL